MTRTPPEPPNEELDELDDEAIVAQQSAAHAPQRRAHVKVESRSVVVADEDSEATRQLEVYTEGTADPTVVVRDRERRAMAQALADMPDELLAKKSWVTYAIWIGAGLLALGLGAVLATVNGHPAARTVTAASAASAAAAAAPTPTHAPASPAVASQGSETDAAAPSDSSAAEPALAPDQLPVEPAKRHKAVSHVRRSARPASHAAAKRKAPQTQPDKGAIPSGI